MEEPQYSSPEEWRKWVMDRADYFTVVCFRPFTRYEARNLDNARAIAANEVKSRPNEPVLIYAVYNTHDCLIEAVNVASSKYNTTGL